MFRHASKGAKLGFVLDGAPREAPAGLSVAAALLGLGETMFRHAPESGAARAPHCLMGACFECLLEIDGARRQSCLVDLVEGMRIARR